MKDTNFMDFAKLLGYGIMTGIEPLFGGFGSIFSKQYNWGKYGRMETTYVIAPLAIALIPEDMRVGLGKKIIEIRHNNAEGYVPRIRVYYKPLLERMKQIALKLKTDKGLEVAVDACF